MKATVSITVLRRAVYELARHRNTIVECNSIWRDGAPDETTLDDEPRRDVAQLDRIIAALKKAMGAPHDDLPPEIFSTAKK